MAIDISDVLRRVVYAPNGVGPYQFTFEILTQTDIDVYKGSTLLTLTTDYTVSINANGTGSVTLVATAGTSNITIVGARGIARTTDFVTGGDLLANSLNDELDAQTIFAQQTYELGLRALKAPVYDPTDINMTLPTKATRANKTLTFDADGNPAAGVSAADVANAVTYATNAANSATAAAASASAASSSASSASSSASTATTQASNASTSASNAASSASAASTSATNAASSASTAATQASNASTSATNAASSASAASTSASNAATSATNASNSASSASTSATNSANSATAAANSATAAAASASAAANTFDSFDDRYLGTKASNPTLDNDGNALVAGALYFSTSENIMKVYDGASWIAATSAGNVSFLRFRYVATSGQTTFSGSDSNAATLSYTVNNIVVFLNGVSLDQTEYTATSGTSVVLGTGAALNDELVIVAFKSFVTADMVPASTGGTYAGAVRFAAGSASVPSISISGDTNTGIFFPAADTIAFTEGGVESMRIDSAGNVGIGTTSPSFRFDLLVTDTTAYSTSAYSYEPVRITNQGAGGVSGILFQAVSTGTANTAQATISAIAESASSKNTALTFGTRRESDGTLPERMRIDSSGNLGLGVTPTNVASSRKLEVGGNTNAALVLSSGSSNASARNWAVASNFNAFGDCVFLQSNALGGDPTTAGTTRMTLDANGNLGIGTSSPGGKLDVRAGTGATLLVAADATNLVSINNYNSTSGFQDFKYAGSTHQFFTGTAGGGSVSERARIDSSGNLLVGETSQTWDERLSAKRTTNAVVGGFYSSATTYTSSVIRAQTEAAAGTGWILFEGRSATGVGRINIYGNGNIQNSNGSYGTLSDIKLKENIVDATPKLEKLQQVRIVNFNLIGDTQKQIGVIAQELEEVFPGLVEDIVDKDDEGNDLGTVTKSVKMSVFVPMLIKAIQEQQAMIDEMKAEIAALKGNA